MTPVNVPVLVITPVLNTVAKKLVGKLPVYVVSGAPPGPAKNRVVPNAETLKIVEDSTYPEPLIVTVDPAGPLVGDTVTLGTEIVKEIGNTLPAVSVTVNVCVVADRVERGPGDPIVIDVAEIAPAEVVDTELGTTKFELPSTAKLAVVLAANPEPVRVMTDSSGNVVEERLAVAAA